MSASAVLVNARNEWVKIIARAKYWVMLVLVMVACLIGLLVYQLMQSKVGVTLDAAQYPMLLLPLLTKFVLPLAILMGVADLLPSELTDTSIRALLVRPISRAEVYMSKVLALFTYACAVLGITLVVTSLLALFLAGGAFLAQLPGVLVSYIVTLAPMLVLICFAMLLGSLMRSPTLTMLLGILLYIVMLLLPNLVRGSSVVLFTNFLSWYNMWQSDFSNSLQRLTVLGLFLSTALLTLIGGILVFERRDV